MFLYIGTLVTIILLILTNAITDAPNAICTLVGTKVMPFKKATHLSACFNVCGIITMSLFNISVANTISNMVDLNVGIFGIIALVSAMISVILFALVALIFGIPTSETHGLIAGITGSGIALYGLSSINFSEWKNVIIGLIWSIIGTYLIAILINKLFSRIPIKEQNTKKAQIAGMCGMSFMHGAQDGQKFIGVLIIFTSILKEINVPTIINPFQYIPIILFTALLMFIGVSIGGKKIVENIGENLVELTPKQALLTDITTISSLFIASITGLPVSTTHAKTVSIIGIGKQENKKLNKSTIKNVLKAWIYTFPICFIFSYLLTKILCTVIL